MIEAEHFGDANYPELPEKDRFVLACKSWDELAEWVDDVGSRSTKEVLKSQMELWGGAAARLERFAHSGVFKVLERQSLKPLIVAVKAGRLISAYDDFQEMYYQVKMPEYYLGYRKGPHPKGTYPPIALDCLLLGLNYELLETVPGAFRDTNAEEAKRFLWTNLHHPLDWFEVCDKQRSIVKYIREPWVYYQNASGKGWDEYGIRTVEHVGWARIKLKLKQRFFGELLPPLESKPLSVDRIPPGAQSEWEALVTQYAAERQRVFDPELDAGCPAPLLPLGTVFRLPDDCIPTGRMGKRPPHMTQEEFTRQLQEFAATGKVNGTDPRDWERWQDNFKKLFDDEMPLLHKITRVKVVGNEIVAFEAEKGEAINRTAPL